MKRNTSLLSAAHALHALISLIGIFAIPPAILHANPAAPIAAPLHGFIHISGESLPLTWVLASLALWLLLLSRIYLFKGLWKLAKQGHLKDFQPPPVPDTAQARLTASCLRLE